MLEDNFGREVSDIRISLTDRCNFDCFYCHNEGLGNTRGPREPQENEMTRSEVLRIARVAHGFGVRNFKLTGGEPMLRKDLEEIVEGIASLDATEVSMTTNGVFLDGRAHDLREKGLERINISMDTPDEEDFAEITRGGIRKVYDGIDAALEAGLTPVKLNMVMAKPMRPYLDEMVEYTCGRDGVSLQIIEYMPELVGGDNYAVDIDEIKSELRERADEVETRKIHHRDRYIIHGTVVEVVDPVGNPEFCANCHRVRVTHDGKLKGCLNRNDDLVPTKDVSDNEIREKFREVVDNRVPYYGEYMTKNDSGDWVRNPKYGDELEPLRVR